MSDTENVNEVFKAESEFLLSCHSTAIICLFLDLVNPLKSSGNNVHQLL
jgi:hypothetical protein